MLNPKEAVDIADKLGVLEAIKTRLVRQPDKAAAKLAAILKELAQVFELCDKEMSRFLSLSFDETALNDTRRILVEFEGASLGARMSSARAAVSRLDNIYSRYLQTWFARLFDAEEVAMVSDLFSDMGGDEADTLDLLSELTQLLSSESSTLLHMLDGLRIPEAKARLATLREQTLPARKALSGLMAGLFALEAEVVARSGAV